MILFWLICAVMLAIALAFVLPTLFASGRTDEHSKKEANIEIYRDQLRELDADLAHGIISAEQHARDRDEIERRLLDDVSIPEEVEAKPVARKLVTRSGYALLGLGLVSFVIPLLGSFRLAEAQPTVGILLLALGGFVLLSRSNRLTAYALALALPVMAIAIYIKVGDIHAMEPGRAAGPAGQQMTQAGIEANVAALAKRMEQNPNDADGWAILGRSYINLEKYREASAAYSKASALKTQDADILIEYAFAMAMANGRTLQGQPAELVQQALRIAPENPRALELAGSAEFEAKNYKQAIAYWEKLLGKSSNSAELTQAITERINEARTLSEHSK
jgi:cytochrome c-type biogenesis protein CcmH